MARGARALLCLALICLTSSFATISVDVAGSTVQPPSRPPRIALLSASDRPSISRHTFPRMREWASRHAFSSASLLTALPADAHEGRSPAWAKIRLLEAAAGATGADACDVVVWLDDDIFVTDLDASLEVLAARFRFPLTRAEAPADAGPVVVDDSPLLLLSSDAFGLLSRATGARIDMPVNTGAIVARCGARTASVFRLLWDAAPALHPRSLSQSQWEQDVFTLLHTGLRHLLRELPGRTLQSLTGFWAPGDFALHAAGLPLETRAGVLDDMAARAAAGEFERPPARYQRFAAPGDMLANFVGAAWGGAAIAVVVDGGGGGGGGGWGGGQAAPSPLPLLRALITRFRPRVLYVVVSGGGGGGLGEVALADLRARADEARATAARNAGVTFFVRSNPLESVNIRVEEVVVPEAQSTIPPARPSLAALRGLGLDLLLHVPGAGAASTTKPDDAYYTEVEAALKAGGSGVWCAASAAEGGGWGEGGWEDPLLAAPGRGGGGGSPAGAPPAAEASGPCPWPLALTPALAGAGAAAGEGDEGTGAFRLAAVAGGGPNGTRACCVVASASRRRGGAALGVGG
jgi:hypothetical protein